jgi:DNA polymerase III epsilon subunit-like protein
VTWKDQPWLIIDTETTGIDVEQDRIVQLGAIVMERGEMVDRRLMTLNPGISIPAEASSVHGIHDRDVMPKPTFGQIFYRFLEHVARNGVLVTYNGTGFDLPLIEAESRRIHDLEALDNAWKDTLFVDVLTHVRRPCFGKWWPGARRHRLVNVARRGRIGLPDGMRAHRADADCYMAGKILWETLDLLPDDADECQWLLCECQRQQDQERREWEAGGRDKWLAKKAGRNTDGHGKVDTASATEGRTGTGTPEASG